MASEEVLRKTLKNADGKAFMKYKGLANNFVLDDFEIIFDDIQNDKTGHTFARVRVPMRIAGFPDDTYDTKDREVALRDLIARRFWETARAYARSPIPKTTGGEVFIPRPGQEILERGSVVINKFFVEVRFTVDLPSDSGKASAIAMELLIFERIRTIVNESMHFSAYKQSKLYNHLHVYENARSIRQGLEAKGLVAFVANGSVLPRRDDDLAPMVDAVPFSCDKASEVVFEVPYGDPIIGMGVRKGFTVITGPTRCGKSVLADALFAGVYDHIPGDGREYVITASDASYVMSEPGRPSDSVDVSMFMATTSEFPDPSCVKASSVPASVSELVSMSEYIEMGTSMIILDEAYSCPSIIRKGFMADGESVTSVSELGHSMADKGVSVVMVSGDESAVRSADEVILLKGFKAERVSVERIFHDAQFGLPCNRAPVSKGMAFEKGRKEVSVTAQSIRTIEIGEYRVDVPVAALFDISQARTIADAVARMKDSMDGSKTLSELCNSVISEMSAEDDSTENGTGMYHVSIRPMDLAAVINRHPQMLGIQRR